MTTRSAVSVLLLVACAVPLAAAFARPGAAAAPAPRQAHMVFFTLKDHSAESRGTFLASCQKYLTGHEGVESFSVGTIAEDVTEPVSVKDFDVSLHIVFKTKEDGATYLKHPRHVQFVEENKEKFAKVRVFDSYLADDKK